MINIVKVCKVHGNLTVDEVYTSINRNKSTIWFVCKKCFLKKRKKYRKKVKEKIRAYNKEHYQKNKEKIIERVKKYQQDNKEKRRNYLKERYKKK